jgi:ribose transport system substrate-binding protein
MIDANVDIIILIAGSSTAPNRVVADACKKGIAVINFDSLVTTDELTAKVNTDSNSWGKQAAEFLVKELGGKGKILVMNGPAGVSVSEDRRAGATPVLKANPGMEIIAETNTPYNVAPAQEAVTNLLFSQPKIDGILSLGGALTAGAILAMDKQGRPMVPMTGENYRQFLELWKEKNLHAWATMQPNWLAGLAFMSRPGPDGQVRDPGLRQPCRCRSSTTATSTSTWLAPRISRPTATSIRPIAWSPSRS